MFQRHYLQRASVDGLINLLVGQRMERGHGDVEQGKRPLERRLRGEAHVALQQVHLRQVDRNHLRTERESHIRGFFASALRSMNYASCLYSVSLKPRGPPLRRGREFLSCHFLMESGRRSEYMKLNEAGSAR